MREQLIELECTNRKYLGHGNRIQPIGTSATNISVATETTAPASIVIIKND